MGCCGIQNTYGFSKTPFALLRKYWPWHYSLCVRITREGAGGDIKISAQKKAAESASGTCMSHVYTNPPSPFWVCGSVKHAAGTQWMPQDSWTDLQCRRRNAHPREPCYAPLTVNHTRPWRLRLLPRVISVRQLHAKFVSIANTASSQPRLAACD